MRILDLAGGRDSTAAATLFLLYLNKETYMEEAGFNLASELRQARAVVQNCIGDQQQREQGPAKLRPDRPGQRIGGPIPRPEPGSLDA